MTLPGDAARVLRSRIRQEDGLQQQVMPPGIAEVVGVFKQAPHTRDNLPQPHSALVDDFALVTRRPPGRARYKRDGQSRTRGGDNLPSPRRSAVSGQLSQSRILPDLDTPPDRRMNVAQ